MPKIRCQGCEAVLNAPDQARGKVIACPKCGAKVKVPAGPATAKPAAAKRPQKEEDLDLASLDLDRLEDSGGEGAQVCPYCAAERDPEDPVCRQCGMNVETGQMDKAESRRRAIKGLDPNLFYANVWKDSWKFAVENFSLAVRSGLFWWILATLNATCAYMAFVFCKTMPTKVFWGSLTALTGFGIPGWYLYVQLKVIATTVLKEEFRPDRIQFDLFQSISGGTRTLFWPLVVIGPLLPLLLLAYAFLKFTGNPLAENWTFILGAIAAVQILPLLTLPIALVHMTTRHSYKAWILWELVKILGKNLGPAIYLLVISVIMFIPTVAIAAGMAYLIGSTNPFVSGVLTGVMDNTLPAAPGATEPVDRYTPGITGNIALWIMKLLELGSDQATITYVLIKGPINILATALLLAPIAFSAGLPALFVMRATGLFGYYRNRSLDIISRIVPGTPATFWTRYLAHTVDMSFMPLTGFLVSSNAKALSAFWTLLGFSVLIWFFSPGMKIVVLLAFPLYTSWMYWSVQESSQLRSTLGKDVFGLIVVTEDDQTMTPKQASFKWFLRVLWYFSGGLPFLMSVFQPEKRALHDLVTRSKVVFKGDK